MTTSSTGAVFFLGSRAHYQVLEPPNNYDVENGNTSTETIYQNQSVEELWPKEQTDKHKFDTNYNLESKWTCPDQNSTVYDKESNVKRRSSEAPLCEMKPAVMNHVSKTEDEEPKPYRNSLISYLTSLARRKRHLDSTRMQYLKHIESVLNNCTYRESCRCLECQSTYFECGEESDEYSSDNDYSPYSVQDVDSQAPPDELDDDVFLDSPVNDNTSTDLLLEDEEEPAAEEQLMEEEGKEDKQLQMEVAASTSAMFNILLYHPFSCVIQ